MVNEKTISFIYLEWTYHSNTILFRELFINVYVEIQFSYKSYF